MHHEEGSVRVEPAGEQNPRGIEEWLARGDEQRTINEQARQRPGAPASSTRDADRGQFNSMGSTYAEGVTSLRLTVFSVPSSSTMTT
jgi:hypothetical protein